MESLTTTTKGKPKFSCADLTIDSASGSKKRKDHENKENEEKT